MRTRFAGARADLSDVTDEEIAAAVASVITAEVCKEFKTFGGEAAESHPDNFVRAVFADSPTPAVFALGVDVTAVVEFVVFRMLKRAAQVRAGRAKLDVEA